MRIILELKALRNQIINNSNYDKLQGFIYSKLINSISVKNLHDRTSYKFFTFSNIFPPSPVKSGDIRYFLFASPDHAFIQSIFLTVRQIIESKISVNIGDQSYQVVSARLVELRVMPYRRCVIRTSTPITIRIPKRSYSQFHIPEEIRKDKFLYWRANLPTDIFIKVIENNIAKKYQSFFNAENIYTFPFIEEFRFLKEVVVHLPIEESVLKIPASFWKFYFDKPDFSRRKLLQFILDSGLGERNSFGLGFINAEEGVEGIQVARVAG